MSPQRNNREQHFRKQSIRTATGTRLTSCKRILAHLNIAKFKTKFKQHVKPNSLSFDFRSFDSDFKTATCVSTGR